MVRGTPLGNMVEQQEEAPQARLFLLLVVALFPGKRVTLSNLVGIQSFRRYIDGLRQGGLRLDSLWASVILSVQEMVYPLPRSTIASKGPRCLSQML